MVRLWVLRVLASGLLATLPTFALGRHVLLDKVIEQNQNLVSSSDVIYFVKRVCS